jgi:hypothetical protein
MNTGDIHIQRSQSILGWGKSHRIRQYRQPASHPFVARDMQQNLTVPSTRHRFFPLVGLQTS